MKSRLPTLSLVAACLVVGGCRKSPAAAAKEAYSGWTLAVEPIPSPASGTTTAPQLMVRGDRRLVQLRGEIQSRRFSSQQNIRQDR